MSKEKGTYVLLAVGDGGTTEVFTDLAGQRNTQMQGAANQVDLSDKTTGGWGSSGAGLRTVSVTTSGHCVWPDSTGLKELEAAWRAGDNINCKLKLNAGGGYYLGAFAVTQFQISGAHDGYTEYSLTLQNNGAVTYHEWTYA